MYGEGGAEEVVGVALNDAIRAGDASANFIAIACLRLYKLKHLPDHPFTARGAQ